MSNLNEQFFEELLDYKYVEGELELELGALRGKTILLIGGSGFLGTAFKKFLLYLNNSNESFTRRPCFIISVDNYIKGTTALSDEILDDNLVSLHHDITLPIDEKLNQISNKVDYIINCSGNASPKQYEKYPYETIDVSITGVKNLLALAGRLNAKILNFSSSEVLGTPPDDEIPTTEESVSRLHALNRRAPYDVSKLMIETLSFLSKERGIDCKIIRPFNVIGYFNKDDFRVIPNYFNKIKHGRSLEVFLPGTQTRTFCFYTDFIVGCFKVLLKGKDILYHIGNSDNEIAMIDLAKRVAGLYGRSDLVAYSETPLVYKTEPKRRCPSIEKARSELGYNPKINLNTMLVKIKNWVDLTY
jgi:UDP-glucuronate decarboxylase